MPLVHIYLREGRTYTQKKGAVEKITQALVESLGVSPESVTILIHEFSSKDYASGGLLLSEKK